MITEAETSLDDFKALIGQPRTIRNQAFAAKTALQELMDTTNDLLNNRLDPLMIRFKYSDTEFYSEYERARTIVDWLRVEQTTINSKMPESCSNYPPTRSKVLQSGSDNPALYSEKYAMNKLNTATNTLTVASDTLTVGTHSENSANRSENPGSRSEHFTGRSEDSGAHSRNIQSRSYRKLF